MSNEEIDIHEFTRDYWLHDVQRWGHKFWGWSMNTHKTDGSKAIFMRVPSQYRVGGNWVRSTPEQEFFNQIRFPLENYKKTVTFNFKSVGAVVWDAESDFFKNSETKIKESIGAFPKYFDIVGKLLLGEDPISYEAQDPSVIEIWKW